MSLVRAVVAVDVFWAALCEVEYTQLQSLIQSAQRSLEGTGVLTSDARVMSVILLCPFVIMYMPTGVKPNV